MAERPHRESWRTTQGRADLWVLLFITIMLVAAVVIMTLKLIDQSEQHVNAVRKLKVGDALNHSFSLKANDTDLFIKEDLRKHPARTEAKYPQQNISEAGMKYISKMKNVRILDLSGCPVKDEWAKYLVDLPLVDLNLEDSEVADTGLEKIATIKTLEKLNLARTQVTDVGIAKLKDLPALKQLNLSETLVTTRGIKSLTGMPHIVSLQIAGTQISSKALQELPKFPVLDNVDLSMNNLNAEDVKALMACKTLMSIKFKGCNIGDDAMEYVGQMPAIQTLELQGNPITAHGLMLLARSKTLGQVYAEGCKNITEIDLKRMKSKSPLHCKYSFNTNAEYKEIEKKYTENKQFE